MTAYLSRGNRIILNAGNATDPELANLRALLAAEGVDVIAVVGRRDLAPAYAGQPSVMIVIEKDDPCINCGYSELDARTFDGTVIDEAVAYRAASFQPTPGQAYTVLDGSHDCDRVDPHHPHPWGGTERGSHYCKGIPS